MLDFILANPSTKSVLNMTPAQTPGVNYKNDGA